MQERNRKIYMWDRIQSLPMLLRQQGSVERCLAVLLFLLACCDVVNWLSLQRLQ